LNERRTGRAKKALRHAEPALGVHAPDPLSAREIHRVELSLGAKGVDDAIGDHGHRARALVEAEIVAVGRRIRVLPQRLAAGGVDSFDDLAIRDAMEEDDAILNDDRAAESLADRPAPDHAWSRSAPYFSQ